MKTKALVQRLSCAAVLLLAPGLAHCQDVYKAPAKYEAVPWAAVAYTLVFLIGIAAVAFKNARRTHLD